MHASCSTLNYQFYKNGNFWAKPGENFVTSLNDLGSRIGEIKRDIKEKGIANWRLHGSFNFKPKMKIKWGHQSSLINTDRSERSKIRQEEVERKMVL